jgi:hypothetical protein
MTRYLLILILCAFFQATAQKSEELEKRNGFKDIKLGMLIDSIKTAKLKKEFKEKDEFPAKLYEVEHPEYEKIGEVDVRKVELKAYKGFIYQIVVTVEKDPRVMKALESIYGKSGYEAKNEVYYWTATTLILKFKSVSKNLLELEYSS